MQGKDRVNISLAEQDYWDQGYSAIDLVDDAGPDVVKDWIKAHVPPTSNGTCFEIGCFPGRFITTFGQLGYELNGIDLTPRVEEEFPAWLKSRGFRTGTFFRDDFLLFKPAIKYDVVCSFGFIEHFTSWKSIFEKHMDMVKPGGYIVIETPNFRGLLQRFIHYFLDYENYKRHYVPSMDPFKWKKMLEKRGFKVLSNGYLGRFQFWVDKQPATFLKTKLFNRLLTYTPRLQKLKAGGPMYAPFCGIIAHLPKSK